MTLEQLSAVINAWNNFVDVASQAGWWETSGWKRDKHIHRFTEKAADIQERITTKNARNERRQALADAIERLRELRKQALHEADIVTYTAAIEALVANQGAEV